MTAAPSGAARMTPLDVYRWCSSRTGGATPGQMQFHADPSRQRRLQAGNQVGKSYAGAAEMWWLVTGTHPYRPGPPLKEGWIVLPDLSGDWPKLSTKIRSLQPGDILAPRCRYDPVRGYVAAGRIGIELRNGAVITPKSGTQDPLAVEGGTVDWIWIDEPPKRSHWLALPQRVAVRDGLIWLTFTPIGRPLGWLREYFDGNPDSNPPTLPAPGWSEIRLQLTPENCPHRTPENIAKQISGMSPWEIRQRRDGDWEGLTEGRRFVSFSEGCILGDEVWTAFTAQDIRLCWDHGEGTSNQVLYLLMGDGKRWIAADEAISEKGSTPAQDARIAVDMLAKWGLTAHHVTAAYGDINSAGKAGAGASVNILLEHEIAKALGLSECPFRIQRPNKRGGSVLAGEKAMNSMLKEGRLFATARTKSLNTSLQHYTGKEQDLKHPIDAIRYGLSDVLLTVPATSRAAARVVAL